MLIDKTEIQNYIPQRHPFVMIDGLLHANEEAFISTFKVQGENVLLENNILSSSAVIENIAQTCAAGFGYLNASAGKKSGEMGFIGAVSRLTVSNHSELEDEIRTTITIINSFDAIHLVEGIAKVNNVELLRCQLKIVVP